MKVGISSACFYPDFELEKSIETMKTLGFDFGEIFLNTYSEYNEKFLEKLLEEKVNNNFDITSVHFFSSMYEPYLFDDYKRRRKDALKVFKEICQATNKLGAKSYTFHGMRKKELDSINKKEILDIYNELSYIARENNIYLSQENVSWCMSSDLEFLKYIKENIKYDLRYTCDIKQAYKINKNPLEYLDVMGEELINFHINDRDEKNICLLPFKGEVEYEPIIEKLKEIKYDGPLIIEVYRNNFKKYEELKDIKYFLEKKLLL
ncbi:sugar phosphate isomerase/epimerase family protein [Clostridium sp. B9]|uniref:sugar phosphate isomerase/epimerase family protein n=1 Tax=Clostridium sp. B9 TaxID=3423224 RepID=UPI003D2ED6BE